MRTSTSNSGNGWKIFLAICSPSNNQSWRDEVHCSSAKTQLSSMGGHSMQMGDSDTDPIEWEDTMSSMNTTSNKNMMTWKLIDTATNKENMDMNWTFKKGDVVKIRIINDAHSLHPMQHPIHMHGQRFLVLDVNGVRNTNLVYKDTVLVQKGQTVDVLVAMDNPGNWVIHCHIPEHMEAAMMTEYHVSNVEDYVDKR